MAKLPLDGVVVLDLGVGMAAALVAKFLSEVGARVTRLESEQGDPFYDIYPAYRAWRSGLSAVKLFTGDRYQTCLKDSDVCILGGEDYPGFDFRKDAQAIAASNPRLIVLDIIPMLPGGSLVLDHAADILIQAKSGLVYEAYSERPALMAFEPSAYGAAVSALSGVSAALYRREGSGRGQIVQAGLLEGAISWASPLWLNSEFPDARWSSSVPKGARPLIFKCRDGVFIHAVFGSIGAKYLFYKTLDIEDPSIKPTDPGLPNPKEPEKFFGDIDFLRPYAERWESEALIAALTAAGVVIERVNAPGECWDDAQVQQNKIIIRTEDGEACVGQPISFDLGAQAEIKPLPPAAMGRGPLDAVTVLDFGAFVAGPSASVGLADLGANVIKIEPPGGDPMRFSYAYFAAANRGKRSIVIDMKTPAGLRLAKNFAEKADVVCSNFKIGVAERLGIDAATLRAAHPEKIVVFNAGYGLAGPKASKPAFDPVMQACSGLEVRAGGDGNNPAQTRTMAVDFVGGMLGRIGILMALYRRAKDGSGAAINIPLLNAGVYLLSDMIRGSDGKIIGHRHLLRDQTGYRPTEKLYQAKDGWIAVSARSRPTAQAFAGALGLNAIAASDPKAWGETEMHALAGKIAAMDVSGAKELFDTVRVPAEICRPGAAREIMANETPLAAGVIYQAQQQKLGMTRGIGQLYTMSEETLAPKGDLSQCGQQSREILEEFGLDPSEIEELFDAKIVA